jgi:hypothetical protein
MRGHIYLLPSIGSVISIVSEASFVVDFIIFFISFTIGYFQLVFIARKAVFEMIFDNKNYYNLIIFELLIIYSFYALTLADIGGYESDMRSSLASVNTDRFSMYTSKISIHNDNLFVIIISFSIPLVLLLTIISMFFNAWMVQYILLITADQKNISSSIPGYYCNTRNGSRQKEIFVYSVNTNFNYWICTYRYSSHSCCRRFKPLSITICNPKYNRSNVFDNILHF